MTSNADYLLVHANITSSLNDNSKEHDLFVSDVLSSKALEQRPYNNGWSISPTVLSVKIKLVFKTSYIAMKIFLFE